MWSWIFARVSSFGLGTRQAIIPSLDFYKKYFCRIHTTKTRYVSPRALNYLFLNDLKKYWPGMIWYVVCGMVCGQRQNITCRIKREKKWSTHFFVSE